jgi:hypothetical protein
MEMTADGPRCFRCSQAAAIAQHHANSAAQLESHNRSVIAMGGFRFWELELRCTQCAAEIDGGPALFSLSLPPSHIACAKCGKLFALTFWHSARWMSSVILKIAFLVTLAARNGALRDAISQGATSVIVQVLLSFGIALGASIVLTIPAVLITRRKPPAA